MWITAPEYAKLAQCKTKDIQRYAKQGVIRWTRTDKKILYCTDDLWRITAGKEPLHRG